MRNCSLFIILIFLSCGSQGDRKTTPTSTSAFKWLEGKWLAHGMEYYETWEIKDDSTMTAVVETDEDGVTEKVILSYRNGQWVYSPTYLSAQMGRAIDFEAVTITSEHLQFENMENDFPNRIVYFHTSENQVDVRIERVEGTNVTKSYDILMSRLDQ